MDGLPNLMALTSLTTVSAVLICYDGHEADLELNAMRMGSPVSANMSDMSSPRISCETL